MYTHLLYVSYVLQILCLLQYFSLLYLVASPRLIVVEKTYSHAFQTSINSKNIPNKDCGKELWIYQHLYTTFNEKLRPKPCQERFRIFGDIGGSNHKSICSFIYKFLLTNCRSRKKYQPSQHKDVTKTS